MQEIKLEPIIPLKNDWLNATINTRIAEMLLPTGPVPILDEEWSNWTKVLANTAENMINKGYLDKLSINMDSKHLLIPSIVATLESLEKTPLIIEWTERRIGGPYKDVMRQEKKVIEVLEHLRSKFGFEIALDDVGSGDCGLRRMTMIEPDLIKLDGRIFKSCVQSARVRSVVAAHIEGYKKIAPVLIEWVETINELGLAKQLGADFAQGYYWEYNDETTMGAPVLASTKLPGKHIDFIVVQPY